MPCWVYVLYYFQNNMILDLFPIIFTKYDPSLSSEQQEMALARKNLKLLGIPHTSWENMRGHPQLFPQVDAHDINDILLIIQVCFLSQKPVITILNK